jgi:hypothetical protein
MEQSGVPCVLIPTSSVEPIRQLHRLSKEFLRAQLYHFGISRGFDHFIICNPHHSGRGAA